MPRVPVNPLLYMDEIEMKFTLAAALLLVTSSLAIAQEESFPILFTNVHVFDGAIANPDNFDVLLSTGMAGGINGLRDAAPMAYEMRTGKAMKPIKMPLLEVAGPEIAEEDFAAALPRISGLVRR